MFILSVIGSETFGIVPSGNSLKTGSTATEMISRSSTSAADDVTLSLGAITLYDLKRADAVEKCLKLLSRRLSGIIEEIANNNKEEIFVDSIRSNNNKNMDNLEKFLFDKTVASLYVNILIQDEKMDFYLTTFPLCCFSELAGLCCFEKNINFLTDIEKESPFGKRMEFLYLRNLTPEQKQAAIERSFAERDPLSAAAQSEMLGAFTVIGTTLEQLRQMNEQFQIAEITDDILASYKSGSRARPTNPDYFGNIGDAVSASSKKLSTKAFNAGCLDASTFASVYCEGTASQFHKFGIEIDFKKLRKDMPRLLFGDNAQSEARFIRCLAEHLDLLNLFRKIIVWKMDKVGNNHKLIERTEIQPLMEMLLTAVIEGISREPLIAGPAQRLPLSCELQMQKSEGKSDESSKNTKSLQQPTKGEIIENSNGNGNREISTSAINPNTKLMKVAGATDIMVYTELSAGGEHIAFIAEIKRSFDALFYSDPEDPTDQLFVELLMLYERIRDEFPQKFTLGLLTDLFCLSIGIRYPTTKTNMFLFTSRTVDAEEFILSVYFMFLMHEFQEPEESLVTFIKAYTTEGSSFPNDATIYAVSTNNNGGDDGKGTDDTSGNSKGKSGPHEKAPPSNQSGTEDNNSFGGIKTSNRKCCLAENEEEEDNNDSFDEGACSTEDFSFEDLEFDISFTFDIKRHEKLQEEEEENRLCQLMFEKRRGIRSLTETALQELNGKLNIEENDENFPHPNLVKY
jgi:hypothetical protein